MTEPMIHDALASVLDRVPIDVERGRARVRTLAEARTATATRSGRGPSTGTSPSAMSSQGPPTPGPSRRQRVFAGVLAFAIFLAAGGFAWRALHRSSSQGPSGSTLPTLVITPGLPSPNKGLFGPLLRLRYAQVQVDVPAWIGPPGATGRPQLRRLPSAGPAYAWGSPIRIDPPEGAEVTATIAHAATWHRPSPDAQPLGDLLPGPGSFVLDVRMTSAQGQTSRWFARIDIGHPGTVQFWVHGALQTGVPAIDMVVNGRVISPGVADAVDPQRTTLIGWPDIPPSMGPLVGVRAGTPISPPQIPPGASPVRVNAPWLDYAAPTPPYRSIGRVDLTAKYPVLDVSAGTYILRLRVRLNQFIGDLLYPVRVEGTKPPTPSAAPAPALSGTIAYIEGRQGYGPIALLDPATGISTRLSRDSFNSIGLAWSPDRTEIALARGVSEGRGQIAIVSARTGTVLQTLPIPESLDPQNVDWSPDGVSLAFTDSKARLHVIGIDGRGLRTIETPGLRPIDLAWSPDTNRIAFVTDRGQLGIVDAVTGRVEVIYDPPSGRVSFGPTWSPDGQSLAFSVLTGSQSDLYTIGRDGSALLRLTEGNGDPVNPTWSPDGAWIAYERGSPSDLFAVTPDGSTTLRLTNAHGSEYGADLGLDESRGLVREA